MPMMFLLQRAFNVNSTNEIAGIPSWAGSTRFDVNAQAPQDSGIAAGPMDPEALAPMMLSLLKERFKLAYHTEQRSVQAYSLVAAKPKLKKADPAARSWCKNPQQIPGSAPPPAGTQVVICQNVTMGQFAERLRGMAPGMEVEPLDATGLEGTWDLTLSFNMMATIRASGLGGVIGAPAPVAGPGANPAAPAASDPDGGYTATEAIEKQLGLKLEKRERTVPVIVIDHMEQTPTEN
jgi:uncharacterized protein (TIGR03435 family)